MTLKKETFHYITKRRLGVATTKQLIIQRLFVKSAGTIRIFS